MKELLTRFAETRLEQMRRLIDPDLPREVVWTEKRQVRVTGDPEWVERIRRRAVYVLFQELLDMNFGDEARNELRHKGMTTT